MPDKPPERIWINLDPERAAVQSPWREKLFDDDIPYTLASQVAADGPLIERVRALLVETGFIADIPLAGPQLCVVDQIANLVAAEKEKMKAEKEIAEARLQTSEEALARIRANHPAEKDVCWHCGVVLAVAYKPRCEDCPDECDEEGCDEMGCEAARTADIKE